jgi:hypothetical protein
MKRLIELRTELDPYAADREFHITIHEEKVDLLSYLPGVLNGQRRFVNAELMPPRLRPPLPDRADALLLEHCAMVNHITFDLLCYANHEDNGYDVFVGYHCVRGQSRKARRLIERFAEKLRVLDPSLS